MTENKNEKVGEKPNEDNNSGVQKVNSQVNFIPPKCEKHNEQMVLNLMICHPHRIPMSEGWHCLSCDSDISEESWRRPPIGGFVD